MSPLIRRIIAEKRRVVLPLAVVLALNVLAYFVVVQPLGAKSEGAADRAVGATNALRAAERELAAVRALVAGKTEAERELSVFYRQVLPADLTAARRMTYARLPALARQTNVHYEARTTTIETPKPGARLGRMTIRMVLEGDYESVRRFIYQVESSPDFVIIDDITLAGGAPDELLRLTINLSTYYRLSPNGT